MKDRFAKLIDLKTIVTLMLISTLVVIVLSGINIEEKLCLLFSNIITSVITFYFAKKDSSTDTESKG